MTTELAIEREANLRAQKKKILQLQRLKYLSGNLEISDGKVAAAETDNERYLFAQETRATADSSGQNVINEWKPAVVCERLREGSTSNLATGDNYVKVSELERSETQRSAPGFKTPVLPRRERQSAEETVESYEAGKKSDGVKISIVVDNAELEQHTPSFASSGSSEYHRKTTEIRKKADERRRNVISPSDRHSSLLNLPSNNDNLNVYVQPRRSVSLTELHYQHDGHDFDPDIKRANTSHRRRSKSEQIAARSPFANAKLESSVLRTSSLSSIYDSFLTTEKHGINFEGFARKQQELLEDNLRRVEQNLDNTFSKLRRYVNTANTIRSTDSQTHSLSTH